MAAGTSIAAADQEGVMTKFTPPGIGELASRFFVLGCTCFGGPSVHLAVFQQMFVGKWFSAALFAELMAFAHVLPGPTSTQVAFLIGLAVISGEMQTQPAQLKPGGAAAGTGPNSSILRTALLASPGGGGPNNTSGSKTYPWYYPGLVSGGLFILPGFALMSLLGYFTVTYQQTLEKSEFVGCVLIGLAAVGWGMVAAAARGMVAGTCGASNWKLLVCAGSCVVTLLVYPTSYVDYAFPFLILLGGCCALVASSAETQGTSGEKVADPVNTGGNAPPGEGPTATAVLLQNSLALLLLLGWVTVLLLCIFGQPMFSQSVFAQFYTTGALVFGGGPVVLPLLDKKLVSTGRITTPEFLAGLSLGQAIPGPMFNLGTYLGALSLPANPFVGAVQGCLGLFSPGVVLIFGLFPFWKALRQRSQIYQRMLPGMNAAATGLIAASLFVLYRQLQQQRPPSLAASVYLVPAIAICGVALVKVASVPEPLAIIAGGVLTGVYSYAVAGTAGDVFTLFEFSP
ncbi:unnamed protein product [Amoebophrya sp. A120]|nr:unnamed protein product [Amoebophrya sp. A120]|eukprot:GSA120T00001331001.1